LRQGGKTVEKRHRVIRPQALSSKPPAASARISAGESWTELSVPGDSGYGLESWPVAQVPSSPHPQGFVADSPLEETGFEPSVPREMPAFWPVSLAAAARAGSISIAVTRPERPTISARMAL
jgi:hypothetical protein